MAFTQGSNDDPHSMWLYSDDGLEALQATHEEWSVLLYLFSSHYAGTNDMIVLFLELSLDFEGGTADNRTRSVPI